MAPVPAVQLAESSSPAINESSSSSLGDIKHIAVRRLPPGVEIKSTRKLGNWELKEQVGSGSYGVVWLAINTQFPNEKVAIKVVDLRLLRKTSEKEALKREALLHSQLHHYHIVQLFQIWESDYEIAFVLELVDGGSLFDFLTGPESNDHALHPNAKRFKVHRDESRAQILFSQMLESIDYLHKNLIVHRDLKLENFLISKDCRTIKLCDFGLSSTFSTSALMKASCGSPLYVPPEVLQGLSYDPTKADLWSLGVTLFAVIFRKMPFLDQRNQLVLEYALRGVRVLPSNLARRLSPQAHEVLCMLLEPDPSKRATVEELMAHPWVMVGKALHRRDQEDQISEQQRISAAIAAAASTTTHPIPVSSIVSKPKRRPSITSFLRPNAANPTVASVNAMNGGQESLAEKTQEEFEAVIPSFLKAILKPRRKNSI